MKDYIKYFVITFISLGAISSLLYFGFDIDLVKWWQTLLILVIMFVLPYYLAFKRKR